MADVEDLVLPKVGDSIPSSGEIPTMTLSVNRKTTKRELQSYLRKYGQATSGNRGVLLERLRSYSQNPEEWISQFRPVQARVRGSTNGTSANKQSAKRTRDLFGDQSVHTEHPSKRAALDVRDDERARVTDDFAQNWAAKVISSYTSSSALVTVAPSVADEATAEHIPANATYQLQIDPLSQRDDKGKKATVASRQVHQSLHQLELQLAEVLHAVANNRVEIPPSTSLINLRGSTAEPSALRQLPQHNEHIEMSTEGVSNVDPTATYKDRTPTTTSDINTRTVTIDGAAVTFDINAVPDPPPTSFADNIDLLFSEWYQSQRVIIAGHRIPVRHWDKIYHKKAGVKTFVWRTMRSNWNNWKFIVEEYETFESSVEFWNEYRDEQGNRLSYTSLLEKLKAKRGKSNQENYTDDANAARKYFGGDLGRSDANNTFTYRKGGKKITYKTDKEVAVRWHKLLEENEEIRRKWEGMQGL